MGADYFGFEAGSSDAVGSEGYLVVNGNVYPALSGPWTAKDMVRGTGGDIPPGQYTYGDARDAPGKSFKDPNSKRGGVFFPIGTGPNGSGAIPDGRPGHAKERTDVGFHFDGGNPGTNGCIGYQQVEAQDALSAETDKTLTVHPYAANLDATRAAVEAQLGHKVDWDKVEEGRRHWPGQGPVSSDVHTKTKRGNKVKKGNTSVGLGKKRRHTAHLEAPLVNGAKIADASTSVFVGTEQKRVARVNDQTTDGSPLADGEGSILVG